MGDQPVHAEIAHIAERHRIAAKAAVGAFDL
jgi:hypothetical protein